LVAAPATPALPAQTLVPPGILAVAPAIVPRPARTGFALWREQLNVLDGHRATVTGTLSEGRRVGRAGRVVDLQALSRHGWRTIASTRTRAHGRFHVSYLPHRLLSEPVRLRFAGDALGRAARRALGRLNAYRLAGASWYGGGGGLACGGSLTSSTLGVANKTLPCGTLVTLRYDGHTVRVPVVDRGPYVAGREFDLTEATKRALGFGDTGQVWSTG
jgi:peptidoglycan lytic transglycosylase